MRLLDPAALGGSMKLVALALSPWACCASVS